jgi:hypothetical protein
MSKKHLLITMFVLVWIGFILALFYVTQKPILLQAPFGFFTILWAILLTCLFFFDAACLGGWLLRKFHPGLDGSQRIFLGTGLGLGVFGLLGFGLAVVGWAHPVLLLVILIGFPFLAIKLGILHQVIDQLLETWQAIATPPQRNLRWIPWLALVAFLFSFVMAFAPAADAFDALSYHLAVPASWLKEGGLIASNINPPYWYPNLVEGVFVWGLALGSEAMTSLLHLAFGSLTLGLLWRWAKEIHGISLAWRTIAILITIPSLPLVASWAYSDLALAFFCTAAMYTLWQSQSSSNKNLSQLSAVFSGLAMGVKYTSFILPLVLISWLVWIKRHQIKEMLGSILAFSGLAGMTACPWYIRNWIWTGNPFFPFLFGGKFWDSFLASKYAYPGTGIGFNLTHLGLLPFEITIGNHDVTFYDGRIGPWWLVLLPVACWILWSHRNQPYKNALFLPALFGVFSLGAWSLGVINTSSLWQTRLLFPALLPLAPLAAISWEELSNLDTQKFRLSFILNAILFLSIFSSLFDFGFYVFSRNPVAVALNIQDRKTYLEHVQPAFADALTLVDQTPSNANIYFLYEPRSYGMNRPVTPDILNANLSHDFYLFHSPEKVLQAWQAHGYTHLLYQRIGDGLLDDPEATQNLLALLDLVAETPNTLLYQIPPP